MSKKMNISRHSMMTYKWLIIPLFLLSGCDTNPGEKTFMGNCKSGGYPFYSCSCLWDSAEATRTPSQADIILTSPEDIPKLGQDAILAVKHCTVRGA